MRRLVDALAILLFLTSAVACDSSAPAPLVAASSPGATDATGPSSSPSPPSVASAPAEPIAGPVLPNRALTPGEVFGSVGAAEICVTGYAHRARNVAPQQYAQVYSAYGIHYPQPAGTYELDHLIPLELGGDNSNLNLWPEPATPKPGFHQKDDLENVLRGLVCAGQLPLADAQSGIAADWVRMYHRYVGP